MYICTQFWCLKLVFVLDVCVLDVCVLVIHFCDTRVVWVLHGVATISRLLKTIILFCKRAL